MAKVDLSKIVSDMKQLYQKDKKVQSLICLGDSVKTEYTEYDGVPLSENHPLRVMLSLPVLPFNKIIEVAGRPDTGKSTWAYETMVAAQSVGIYVILTDAEDKLDASRFTKMGGDPKKVLLIKSNETLKSGELMRKFIIAIKEQDPDAKFFYVHDSIGASQSRSHAERELDNEKHAQPGQDAKENSSLMKMFVALINKYPDSIAIYLVNQVYAKIGFMQKGDAIPGGSKIEFHSSFIVMLRRVKVLTKVSKGVTLKTGIISRATVVKNHLSAGKTSIQKLDFIVDAMGTNLAEGFEEEKEEDGEE